MSETIMNNDLFPNENQDTAKIAVEPVYVSWSAVFSGVIITLIIHILMTLLGTAIGATNININEGQNILQHLRSGTLFWTTLNMLSSIAVGSYVAGRLAHHAGALHGLLMFGVSTIIVSWLAMSITSSVLNGAFKIIDSSVEVIGQGMSAMVNPIKYHSNINTIGSKESFPPLKNALHQITIKEPQSYKFNHSLNKHSLRKTDIIITKCIRGMIGGYYDSLSLHDKNILKNFIKSNTGKSNQEVDKIINDTQQIYKKYIKQLKQETEHKSKQAAQQAAHFTAKVSSYMFFILLMEAITAIILGHIGRRNALIKT